MHGIKVLMAKNYVDNLSEEVKKGLREKAEQGHWPTVAHVGYVNNRETRRIDVDPVRGPLVAQGLRAVRHRRLLARRAAGEGARDRPHPPPRHSADDQVGAPSDAAESDLHGRLPLARQDPSRIAHAAHLARDLFARVQAVLQHKPRGRYQKQRHPFMGLLTCGADCGCTMTAELKKGKYVYYRCTGFKGRCGNTYIRQEALADLLGDDGRRHPDSRRRSPTSLEQALQTSQSLADPERRETQRAARQAAPGAGLEAGSRLRRLPGGPDLRGLLDAKIGAVGGGATGARGRKSPASTGRARRWRSRARRF